VTDQATRVTLQDVADRAGVSITTASRVVNDGQRRVGADLAHRVHQAAAELGYTANLQARAVATGRSSMVGVVVHDIADPYFSSIAAGLIEIASRSHMLVCMSAAASETGEREYVSLMRAQRARAVVLIGSRTGDAAARAALGAEIAAFIRQGGRAVCVGQPLLGVDTIEPQNAVGASALARALAALGHTDCGIAAVLLGSAYGLCLVSGLRQAEQMAGPTERGAVVACYYALAYLGFATPYLAAGLGAVSGQASAFGVLAGIAVVIAAGTAGYGLRRSRAQAPPDVTGPMKVPG